MSEKENFLNKFQLPQQASKVYFPADLPTDFFFK